MNSTEYLIKVVTTGQGQLSHLIGLSKDADSNMSRLGNAVNTLKSGNSKFSQSIGLVTEGIESQIPALNGLGASVSSLANPYVIAGAAAAGVSVAIAKSTQHAMKWDNVMSKVNVTAGLGKAELKLLSNEILNVSNSYAGSSILDVPEAYNQILSATGDVALSTDILRMSVKASAAGYTDLKTTAEAAVNVMGSTGIKDSQRVYDVLFMTLNKGKGEFADIANYLPKILPQAQQLGFQFEETAAAFAYMTSKGQSVEQTTQLLQNMYAALGNKDRQQNLKEVFGIDTFDQATGKMKSLIQIIEEVKSGFADASTEAEKNKLLNALGLDREAASAVAVLTQDTAKLQEFIQANQNASSGEGALSKALKDSSDPTRGINQLMNTLSATAKQFGDLFTPFIDQIASQVIPYIIKISTVLQALLKNETFQTLLSMAYRFVNMGLTTVVNSIKNIVWVFNNLLYPAATWVFDKISTALHYVLNLFGVSQLQISSWSTFFTNAGKNILGILVDIADTMLRIITLDFTSLPSQLSKIKNKFTSIGSSPEQKTELPKATQELQKESPIVNPNSQKQINNILGGNIGGASRSQNNTGMTGIRNNNIRIDKLVGDITISNGTTIGMTVSQIREMVTQALVGAVHDTEIAIS